MIRSADSIACFHLTTHHRHIIVLFMQTSERGKYFTDTKKNYSVSFNRSIFLFVHLS